MKRARLSEWRNQGRKITVTLVIVSLFLHAALLLLIIFFAGRVQPVIPPVIPIKLVMQPPPEQPAQKEQPKPPSQQQQQKQQQEQKKSPPPPRGRLASDELGDTQATEKDPTTTEAPASGAVQSKSGEAPPPPSATEKAPKPSDMARPTDPQEAEKDESVKQEDIPQTTEKLALGGALAPPPPTQDEPEKPDEIAGKKVPKPSSVRLRTETGGAREPTPRPDDPDHGGGKKAPYPGPAASRDEYIAYIRDLTTEQLAKVPPQYYEGRIGTASFDVRIRPNGTIVWFTEVKNSGYPDTDHILLAVLNGIAGFPPLPPELKEPNGNPTQLNFSLSLSALGKPR